MARLLGTDDGDYDMTAYQTYEGGAQVLLSGKVDEYSDGSKKTKLRSLKTELIHAARASRAIGAEDDVLTGASIGYVFERSKETEKGNKGVTYGGVTLAGLIGEESLYGLDPSDRFNSKTGAIGAKIGHRRVFVLGKKSEFAGFAELNGEGSYGAWSGGGEDFGVIDGIAYARVGVSGQTQVGDATIKASHSRNINPMPSLSWNTGADLRLTSDRKTTEFSVLVPKGETTFSGSYRVIADVQRTGQSIMLAAEREKVSA